MQWQPLSNIEILKRLEIPAADSGKVLDMVLDTDTYNEVDDQFALCYALCSPERLNVQAVYAAPFFNDRSNGPEQGMERSYDEIVRLLGKDGPSDRKFRIQRLARLSEGHGHPAGQPGGARSGYTRHGAPGRRSVVRKRNWRDNQRRQRADNRQPRLARKIIVVWLGGNSLTYPHTREFNLMQDVPAARTVLDSGVPFILVPCMGVASQLLTSVPELQACIGGKNELCDTLIDILMGYNDDHFAWGKEIWDISTIAMLINPDWEPTDDRAQSAAVGRLPLEACDARRHPIKGRVLRRIPQPDIPRCVQEAGGI